MQRGQTSLAAWRTTRKMQGWGNLDSDHKECTCTAHQQTRRREVCPRGWHLVILPNPKCLNTPTPLTSHFSLALDLGKPETGGRFCLATWEPGSWSRLRGSGHHWHLIKQHPRSSPDLWWQHSHSNPCQHTTIPTPSRANTLVLPTPCHNLALDLGQSQDMKRDEPGPCLSRASDS